MCRFSYIIAFLLFFSVTAAAQTFWRIEGKSLLELKQEDRQMSSWLQATLVFPVTAFLPFIARRPHRPGSLLYGQAQSIPKAYRYEDLAFFCRIEVQMEAFFKMPVKFRLGEVQYVEQMEGKY